MESLHSVTEAVQPQEFMASLDLTEADLHIPILPSHRRYLRFFVGDQHLQFRVLPFGLSMAPRVSTKVLEGPIAFLRQKGIHIHPYSDNLLIRSSSEECARKDTNLSEGPQLPDQHRKEGTHAYPGVTAPGDDNRYMLLNIVPDAGTCLEDQRGIGDDHQ